MNLKERVDSMRSFFNEHIGDYDDKHAPFMSAKEQITEQLPEGTQRVLDLGAGTGLELFALFRRFPEARVVAVDVSDLMLEKLRTRPFAHLVECRQGDFFEVELGEGYDAVISSSALHHFAYDDKLLLYRRLYRALKPGGTVVICDYYSKDNAEEAAHFIELKENPNGRSHVDTPLTMEHERELMEACGFTEIRFLPSDPNNHYLQMGVKPK